MALSRTAAALLVSLPVLLLRQIAANTAPVRLDQIFVYAENVGEDKTEVQYRLERKEGATHFSPDQTVFTDAYKYRIRGSQKATSGDDVSAMELDKHLGFVVMAEEGDKLQVKFKRKDKQKKAGKQEGKNDDGGDGEDEDGEKGTDEQNEEGEKEEGEKGQQEDGIEDGWVTMTFDVPRRTGTDQDFADEEWEANGLYAHFGRFSQKDAYRKLLADLAVPTAAKEGENQLRTLISKLRNRPDEEFFKYHLLIFLDTLPENAKILLRFMPLDRAAPQDDAISEQQGQDGATSEVKGEDDATGQEPGQDGAAADETDQDGATLEEKQIRINPDLQNSHGVFASWHCAAEGMLTVEVGGEEPVDMFVEPSSQYATNFQAKIGGGQDEDPPSAIKAYMLMFQNFEQWDNAWRRVHAHHKNEVVANHPYWSNEDGWLQKGIESLTRPVVTEEEDTSSGKVASKQIVLTSNTGDQGGEENQGVGPSSEADEVEEKEEEDADPEEGDKKTTLVVIIIVTSIVGLLLMVAVSMFCCNHAHEIEESFAPDSDDSQDFAQSPAIHADAWPVEMAQTLELPERSDDMEHA